MTRIFSCAAAFAVGFLTSLASTDAADWPHYRGPAQDGTTPEKVAAQFPSDGPKSLWKASVGIGTSAVVVSGDRAYTMGNTGGKDIVYCFDARSGKELWRFAYPLGLDKRMFEGGPASTPTVDGNRVYTVSHQGDLFCLDATSGKHVWQKHYQKDLGGRRPQWGFAGSPTVEGNALLLDVGGKGSSTVALDKATGKVLWKSGDDEPGYATPVVGTIAGKRTVVMFKAGHVVGLDVKDGSELWRSAWKTSYDVNAASPLIIGDRIFISSGYDTGCALLEVSGGKATQKWRNKSLRSQLTSPVAAQGHVFGIDGNVDSRSPLVGVALENGSVKWQEKSVTGGALVLAGEKLVVLTERGELVIGEASPDGFKATARAQVLGKRNWVQPTVASGMIFCRNNDGDVVCLAAGG